MRGALALIVAMMMTAPAMAGQDPRIPQAEQDADRIEAQRSYDAQRQRDQAEADRVARITLERKTDYELYLARQKADQPCAGLWQGAAVQQGAEFAVQEMPGDGKARKDFLCRARTLAHQHLRQGQQAVGPVPRALSADGASGSGADIGQIVA